MNTEKIKNFLKSKKGKTILFSSGATIFAAAIIAAAVVNISKPKEIILKQGAFAGNTASVPTGSTSSRISSSVSSSSSKVTSSSKAASSKSTSSTKAPSEIKYTTSKNNTVKSGTTARSSDLTQNTTTSKKNNTTSTKKPNSGSSKGSGSSGSSTGGKGKEIIVSQLPIVNRGTIDNVSVSTRFDDYSHDLFINFTNNNSYDVTPIINGRIGRTVNAKWNDQAPILGTAHAGNKVTITIEGKALTFSI